MSKALFDFKRIHIDTAYTLNIYETASSAPNFSWVREKVTCDEV